MIMKRLILFVLLLPGLAASSFAQVVINGISYDLNQETQQATVVKGEGYKGNMSIPAEVVYESVPYSVVAIAMEAFGNCKELTSILLPNTLKIIYEEGFWYSGLKSISIPNSVIQIEDYGFARCNDLETVVLGSGMTRLSKYAFESCGKLKDMYCYTSQVLSASSRSFNSASCATAILHVPADLVETYKVTEPWRAFGTIIPLTDSDPKPTSGIYKLQFNNEPSAVNCYDLQGRKIASPQKGIYINDGKKVIVK